MQQYTVNPKEFEIVKETYISNINALVNLCDDISLLDLIQKLLEKSI